MGNYNELDSLKGRMNVTRDMQKKDLCELLIVDVQIFLLLSVFYFIGYEVFSTSSILQARLLPSQIIEIMNNSLLPIGIFWISSMAICVYKFIQRHLAKDKENNLLFNIVFIMNIVIGVIFLIAYLYFLLI